MITRFHKLFPDIVQVTAQEYIEEVDKLLPKSPALKAEMLKVTRLYTEFLQPFKKASLKAQGATFLTLPFVARIILPIVKNVSHSLLFVGPQESELMKAVKTEMRAQFQKFYTENEIPHLAAALLMDPFHAHSLGKHGVTPSEMEKVYELLAKLVEVPDDNEGEVQAKVTVANESTASEVDVVSS